MKHFYKLLTFASLLLLYVVGCETATSPNDIGGETNIDLTKVGGEFSAYFETQPPIENINRIKDSTVITKNENGLVSFHHYSTFDSVFVRALDSALGIEMLPSSLKLAYISDYLKRFNATLDTSDKSNIILKADFRAKITSEGIQEYYSSNNDFTKPHTIVKYNWEVGNVYEFVNSDGVAVKRTVVSKSVADDYPIAFWSIKVTKVEETKEDPIIEKITYITNHKFGLVGVAIKSKNGKQLQMGVLPPNL